MKTKSFFTSLLLTLIFNLTLYSQEFDSNGLMADIEYLSSDQLEGRFAGTEGEKAAVIDIGDATFVVGIISAGVRSAIAPGTESTKALPSVAKPPRKTSLRSTSGIISGKFIFLS